jgi:hypothetical protein
MITIWKSQSAIDQKKSVDSHPNDLTKKLFD